MDTASTKPLIIMTVLSENLLLSPLANGPVKSEKNMKSVLNLCRTEIYELVGSYRLSVSKTVVDFLQI
jgi:hypothetical protein